MSDSCFERYEKKYLLTKEEYEQVMSSLQNHMKVDQYGLSTICNIYYDTLNYRLIRESIEKPVYKEKLRLRCYGVPKQDTVSYVEIKKKYEGIVYKRRISLPYSEAYKWLSGDEKDINLSDESGNRHQIEKEIAYFKEFYKDLQPACVLCYDRIALYGIEDKEIRVTMDSNIRWRTEDLDLLHGDQGSLLFDEDYYLMEIKVPKYMPEWLIRLLNDNKIYPTSFSKYGNVYKSIFE
ncbi:MAG: polyphosphate polymerase domain-containing protein [Lachnospiraceae bacterium]|nr:polyphosphate polymerase domain-containing protein [Candidatus Merdinaster equi]